MYGFIMNRKGRVAVANRVFETLLYDYFLAEEQDGAVRSAAAEGRNRFVRCGRLDMRAVLEGFRRTYVEVYGPLEEEGRFAEFDGRRQFLLYLKPIINGTGTTTWRPRLATRRAPTSSWTISASASWWSSRCGAAVVATRRARSS